MFDLMERAGLYFAAVSSVLSYASEKFKGLPPLFDVEEPKKEPQKNEEPSGYE